MSQSTKESKASARKAHYAAGGTPAMWRGRSSCLDQAKSKGRQNKMACRGRFNGEG